MGTFSTHKRIAEVNDTVPLHIVKVKRRHYLLYGPTNEHQDFLIVDLLNPIDGKNVMAEVKVDKAVLK